MSYVRDRFDDLQRSNYEDDQSKVKGKKQKTMDKSVKDYLDKCEELRQKINSIKDDTNKVNDTLLHKKFYKLQDLQNEVNPPIKRAEDACMAIHAKLKEMTIDRDDLETSPNAETKMKYMQYTTLKEDFHECINKHIECVKRYELLLEEIKKRIQLSINGEYEQSEELVNETQAFIGNYLIEQQAAELELRDIKERHNQLVEIENQLKDVRDLFVNIAILVEQQQESINRAEHHAAISSRTIEMANDELVKAKGNKRKSNKIKIILIIVAIIIVMILIILLFK